MVDRLSLQGNKKIHANAVFGGGGVRGIGHVGALKVAEKYGYVWDHIAGCSIGAIVAALVAAGYRADEIGNMIRNIDFNFFADNQPLDVLHIRDAFNFLISGGFRPGNYIEEFVQQKLKVKGIETFGQLIDEANKDNSSLRYRLAVIASDVTTGRMLILPRDIALYGMDPDKLSVAKAVRMSISVPFFFTPIDLPHAGSTITSRIVDGALLSNFPLFLFEDVKSLYPVIGFRLTDFAIIDGHEKLAASYLRLTRFRGVLNCGS